MRKRKKLRDELELRRRFDSMCEEAVDRKKGHSLSTGMESERVGRSKTRSTVVFTLIAVLALLAFGVSFLFLRANDSGARCRLRKTETQMPSPKRGSESEMRLLKDEALASASHPRRSSQKRENTVYARKSRTPSPRRVFSSEELTRMPPEVRAEFMSK
ncbi:MAG: hypothetical protein GXP32_06270 [Kiritimatiellaeota bacterium]|nr:hypothetical protein [Kiritimatiellota bacterium]